MRKSVFFYLSIGLLLSFGTGLSGVAQQIDSAYLAERGLYFDQHRSENFLGMPHEWITLSNTKGVLLEFTTLDMEGDSNSQAFELGQMELKDNQLICYTSWIWGGDAPASPAGVRKLVYVIAGNGCLDLENADIFIEVIRPGFVNQMADNEWLQGVRFVRNEPIGAEQERLLQNYTEEIEQQYRASFVRRQKGTKLEKEVLKAMRETIQKYTAHWETVFPAQFLYPRK